MLRGLGDEEGKGKETEGATSEQNNVLPPELGEMLTAS